MATMREGTGYAVLVNSKYPFLAFGGAGTLPAVFGMRREACKFRDELKAAPHSIKSKVVPVRYKIETT